MRGIFHIHTDYSIDGLNSVDDIYVKLKELNIDFVAITDHDSIAGSVSFNDRYGHEIYAIISGEYSTTEGHMMVLFLENGIENILEKNDHGLYDFEDLVHEAKKQDAIIVAAHPKTLASSVLEKLDGIEVFNSRVLDVERNRRAERLARDNNLIFVGGADAHLVDELTNCISIIDDIDVSDLKTYLLSGGNLTLECRTGNHMNSAKSQLVKMKRLRKAFGLYHVKQYLKILYGGLFELIKAFNKDMYNYKIRK